MLWVTTMSVKTEWKKTGIHMWGEQRESYLIVTFLGRENVSVLIAEGGNASRQRLLTKVRTVGKGRRITAYARKQNLGEGLGLNVDEKNRNGNRFSIAERKGRRSAVVSILGCRHLEREDGTLSLQGEDISSSH